MPELSSAELTAMRATANDFLGGTAVLQRKTYVSDSGGGGTTTWSAHGTVDARMAPVTAARDAEAITGGRLTADANWIITLPANTDITTEDRIVIDGRTMEVAAVPDRTWEITRAVLANEVT